MSGLIIPSTASKPFQDLMLYVYGHSFTQVPTFQTNGTTTGQQSAGAYGGEWPARVASTLGMIGQYQGLGGMYMQDVVNGAIGTIVTALQRGRTLVPGSKGVFLLEAGYNEVNGNSAPADARLIAAYKNCMRTFVALTNVQQRIESSTATTSGTWATVTNTTGSAGSWVQSSSVGATLTFNNVSAPAGYIWVSTFAYEATTSGTVGVEVDGVDQGIAYTGVLGARTATILTGATAGFCQNVIKVTVPNTGTHTIVIKKSDASGSLFINIDGLWIPSTTPSPVFIVKEPPNASTTTAAAGGTYANAYTTYMPAYNTVIDQIVTEFSGLQPVYAVDTSTGWDNTKMINSTDPGNFHPGNFGAKFIASKVASAIITNATATDPGVTG